MNAQSIERQRIGRRGKIEKGMREQEKVSGIERKGSDSEEWRQLKISAKRSVITEGGRQTASFFFLHRNKDTHQFKSAGFLDLTFSLSGGGVGGRCFSPSSCPFIRRRKKTPLQGHPG